MLFNSEVSIFPNRRKLRKTIFVSEYSTEIDSDNSQNIELNKTNYQDGRVQSKQRGSLLQNTKSETELHSVGLQKQSYSFQPSANQQEDQQNVITQLIPAPQKFHNHRYSLSSFDKMENGFQSSSSRQSVQLQQAGRRISYNDFENNAQYSQQMPQLKNKYINFHPQEDLNNNNNFPNQSQFNKNYFYPAQYPQQDIRQTNTQSSSLNYNFSNQYSLRGTQSGFLLKNQANIFQEDQTKNFQVNPTKNAQNTLHNILSGNNLKNNNYNNKYIQTRIKSLNNLSSTLKRIEELETNTSIKNDSNISIMQKSDRMIQFAKKHDTPIPNLVVSPIDLLKKQPSKGVLKNSSKILIKQQLPNLTSQFLKQVYLIQKYSSQSNIENYDEDETIQSMKDNLSSNNKSLGNLRNLKRTPSSLEEIPEVEINNYNDINQNQDFLPILQSVQPRVRKIIRNGTVIKKVQNDIYEQKDDQSIQSEGVSPKKKQMGQSNIFGNAQSDGRLFEDVLSSSSSPKKRISKISMIQPII
ncbi:hypothetical protein TTHERM_00140840 (macronuclear) [Tetrahymena thermophila SB210]|uniref:Uncharacterized protein n=1 Tax=Tetrahymena thermophila (strain SB210) TaxID=312017 RepID=I7M0R1_TETTS|nr:hypothetical protein TTHERM_00140840 [Tetrahymena thermophila SB210]EAR90776.1 hypothetical protein TTHERM_00140840 [Tetrahymena thermophila SB210]|eukprot:XP_001011021.1 hypothetical protein TTHERM_00140840 [Tetrahymena thermophila SB210]